MWFNTFVTDVTSSWFMNLLLMYLQNLATTYSFCVVMCSFIHLFIQQGLLINYNIPDSEWVSGEFTSSCVQKRSEYMCTTKDWYVNGHSNFMHKQTKNKNGANAY